MASSQDIDYQLFVRPKKVPPIPLVDGLPVPIDNPYHLPNDGQAIGTSGPPHRKSSLPASPNIPTIPTVDSGGELSRHTTSAHIAGAGSRLASSSTLPTGGVPISKPRAMSRLTPYGGVNNPPAKKKGVFGGFSLGRGRSTYRPSMLSKPVVVVQSGPTVSVHVPAGVAPPPQVGMAMRRSRSAPPAKDRGGGPDVESLTHATEDGDCDSGLALGVRTAVEIMRSMSGNPGGTAVELAIGEVQIGSATGVTVQELEPVPSAGTDEGVADVSSGEVTFEYVGEGYDIRCRPGTGAQGGDFLEDSSFELVGTDGYPEIDNPKGSTTTSSGASSDSGLGAPAKANRKSKFSSSARPLGGRILSTNDDSVMDAKKRRQFEKEEAQSRKAMSRIMKEEAKMERQSLKLAMTELESLQRAHKESMKLEANAITGHSKTKSEHTKNLSLFEGLKREYQIMERKVETSAMVLKQVDEALEQHKERVREAMHAVKQKKEEVDIWRTQRDMEERERVVKLSGLKKREATPDAPDGDRIVSDTVTKQKARSRFSGVMAPL